MDNHKLRVGVAGVGFWGRRHARTFSSMAHVDLAGLFDPRSDRLDEVAEEYDVRTFASESELISEVEALSVACPTVEHFKVAAEAIENGKHVLIEKPIAATLEEAQRLVDMAEEKGVVLSVGHIERFNPAILAARAVVRDPGFIEAHRLAPFAPRGIDVPVVFDLMIHDIDIALSMVDSEISSIAASGINVFSRLPDIANARLTFENGCVANLTASRISIDRFRKIRFFQQNTYVSVDYIAPKAEVYSKNVSVPDDLDESEFSKLSPLSLVDYKSLELLDEEPLKLELGDFVDSVVNERTPTVTGHDGLRALDVAMRIMQEMGPDI